MLSHPAGAMAMTLILSNDDVEKLLTMHECIEVMEEAYVELADGRGVSRTRSPPNSAHKPRLCWKFPPRGPMPCPM